LAGWRCARGCIESRAWQSGLSGSTRRDPAKAPLEGLRHRRGLQAEGRETGSVAMSTQEGAHCSQRESTTVASNRGKASPATNSRDAGGGGHTRWRWSSRWPGSPASRLWLLLACLVPLAGGCQAPQEESTAVGITGIDHLADHLSVQDFSVAGYGGGRAGGGCGTVCCTMLPDRW